MSKTAPAFVHRPSDALSEKSRKTLGLKQQQRYALPKLPGAADARTIVHGTGTYTGAELRPYDGRAGSMRAYSIPSRGMQT